MSISINAQAAIKVHECCVFNGEGCNNGFIQAKSTPQNKDKEEKLMCEVKKQSHLYNIQKTI